MTKELKDFPDDGFCRWNDFKQYMFISRMTFLRLGKAGKAPMPQRMNPRLSYYRNSEIKRWMANPSAYSNNQS